MNYHCNNNNSNQSTLKVFINHNNTINNNKKRKLIILSRNKTKEADIILNLQKEVLFLTITLFLKIY